jgi:hypothetical protein
MKYLLAFLIGLLAINIFGILFATGSAHPYQMPKTITITVPFNAPIH